jgi:hypothetical protein
MKPLPLVLTILGIYAVVSVSTTAASAFLSRINNSPMPDNYHWERGLLWPLYWSVVIYRYSPWIGNKLGGIVLAGRQRRREERANRANALAVRKQSQRKRKLEIK